MRARLSSFALITALLYIAAVVVLLAAISLGMTSSHSVGALGAAVAAVTALAGLVLGFRLARESSLEENDQENLAAALSEAESAPDPAPLRATSSPAPRADEPAPPSVRVAAALVASPSRAPSSPSAAAPAAPARFLPQEQLDAIPIGFAALDRDLFIRAVNPALEGLLGVSRRALVGRRLRDTALGAAVYSGPRAGLAGLRLCDVAASVRGGDEPLDLSRLLVPGNGGDGWAARLTARLHAWPRSAGKPESLFVWVQEEALGAAGAPARNGERVDEVAPTLGAEDRARIAEAPDPAAGATRIVRLHDALARLQLVSAIARWLHEEMAGADAEHGDLRRRAELQMIEIQAKRIAASLQTLADDASRPQIPLDSESGPAV